MFPKLHTLATSGKKKVTLPDIFVCNNISKNQTSKCIRTHKRTECAKYVEIDPMKLYGSVLW